MTETILDVVRTLLRSRRSDVEFKRIADACKIGKNTVYRIADNPDYDPGFSKVQILYNHLTEAA